MSTNVMLSKCYLFDEEDSPLARLNKIEKEIKAFEFYIKALSRIKEEVLDGHRDYFEVIKEFI